MTDETAMALHSLLTDPAGLSHRQAEDLQRALASEVRVEPLLAPVARICGVDCAYSPDGSRIYAAAVLLAVQDLSIIAVSHATGDCRFPYISGLLAFREAPAMVRAIGGLPMGPDIVMCDGHGIAHPRGLGLASVIGLALGIPTIGVAKRKLFGEYETPGLERPACSPLFAPAVSGESARRIGTVLRTQTAARPLFVSPGHGIGHEESIDWVLRLTERWRQPEPLRLAHQEARRVRSASTL